MTALAGAGWAWALVTTILLWRARMTLAQRGEAVVRAAHELRGSLHAAGLALHSASRALPSGVPLAAVEVALDSAALAVLDIEGHGGELDERFDLGAVIERQTPAWTLLAQRAGRELRVECMSASLPASGDPQRLAQALGNLVANALEHGSGRVEVRAWAMGGEALVVEVADEGRGLPATVEVLTARPRKGKGRRGRGLAIAASAVSGLGGRLSAEPAGRGSRLVVELPLRPS